MFKAGELIKRKTLSDGRSRALCVVVEKTEDNYTLYNNSLKCLQSVACVVINNLYIKHAWVCLGRVVDAGYVIVFVSVWWWCACVCIKCVRCLVYAHTLNRQPFFRVKSYYVRIGGILLTIIWQPHMLTNAWHMTLDFDRMLWYNVYIEWGENPMNYTTAMKIEDALAATMWMVMFFLLMSY